MGLSEERESGKYLKFNVYRAQLFVKFIHIFFRLTASRTSPKLVSNSTESNNCLYISQREFKHDIHNRCSAESRQQIIGERAG